MTQNTVLSHSSLGISKLAARMVIVFSATFLAILFLLHFLEPEFDPSWRMISEYALGRYGWGGSVLALLVALWPYLRTIGGVIGRGWLLLIGVALFGAGIFKTNPITDTTISTANSLHALCGAFVILTFPIAASIVAGSLARNQEWFTARRPLLWVTLLVWFGILSFFGSIIISNAINPSAGRMGPEVLLGWPNRFLVVAYHIWLIIIARRAQSQSQ
jgi:hypothetical protein